MAHPDYQDTFEIAPMRAGLSIVEAYAAMFGHIPNWFRTLIAVRNKIVAPFGVSGPTRAAMAEPIDTRKSYAVGETIGRWKIVSLSSDEIVAGLDDVHLNFLVSVRRGASAGKARITLTTAVDTHNSFGRAYLATILPFHRFGVALLMSDAVRAGRL